MSVCWCYYVIFRGLVGYGGVGWLVEQKRRKVCMDILVKKMIGQKKIPWAIHGYVLVSDCTDITKHFRYHPNGGILTYISCMDTAYVRENPP